MATKYFCCFHSYREKLAALTDEQVGRVFRAALIYSETGELPELPPLESLAFGFIRYDIDQTQEEYERRCATNRANASRRKASPPIAAEDNQVPTTTVKENGTENEREGAPASPPSRARPPTLDEVKEYCRERQSTVSAESFFDFYTANGWKQGQGKPIKDWRAAVRTWERRDRENGKRFIPPENKPEDDVIIPF